MRQVYLAFTIGALLFAGPALADIQQYTFSYTPTPYAGPYIQGFSFSFDTPTFLGPGDPFTFTPFDITDGTDTFTINTSGSYYIGPLGGCWLFGSGDQILQSPSGTCEIAAMPTGNADMWFAQFNPGGSSQSDVFPTTDGTVNYFVNIFSEGIIDGFEGNAGVGTLTVADVSVPEPTAMLLFATVLAGLLIKNRRFLAR